MDVLRHIVRGLVACAVAAAAIGDNCAFAGESTVFTMHGAESDTDRRFEFDNEVLALALEKTVKKYGPYTLRDSPKMNFKRAFKYVSSNTLPNFFIKLSYEDRFVDHMGMDYVRFPVDLGIVGYRVCFVSAALKGKLENTRSIEELKKFTHGQGASWADARILRENGFNVVAVENYESLFEMVAANRFDLFCRGANELLDEWESHKNVKGLTFDRTIVIYYPLPRFFYTNKANKKGMQRIQEGILIAHNDGSLKKAWDRKYKSSVDFADLGTRRVFKLENPLVKRIDFDYQQYLFDPFAGVPDD